MELLGGAVAALAAVALLVLAPASLRGHALLNAAFYAVVTGPLSVVAPVARHLLRIGLVDVSQAVPTPGEAVRGLAEFVVLRGGVALILGVLLARWAPAIPARPLVVILACVVAGLAEVALRLDDILAVARMFPLVAVADLLLPEVAPALLGAAATALWATRGREA
jgi:hypothetical protein